MSLRRTAAALAASTALCAVAAPVAAADESPSARPLAQRDLPPGLYGKDDPQYDGVWRQSTALLAQEAVGVEPAAEAVSWLTGQQCEDGSFASYRPDPARACTGKTVADVNATAAAVQALAALGGHGERVERAVKWLRTVQNDDGGWGFNPGGPSDANSVSVVIGALDAADEDPARTLSAKGGKSPYDSLLGFQLGCGAEEDERGAFAYQPDEKGRLAANDDATAAAVLAARGEGLAAPSGGGGGGAEDRGAAKALECAEDDGEGDGGGGKRTPAEAADAGAAYLTRVLEAGGGHLRSAMPGAEEQPDYGNTADAVIALAAGGHRDAAGKSLTWLERNLDSWDRASGSPAALGQLVLAARAAGGDPADFGGVNLVERLNATGPAPASVPSGGDGGRKEAADDGGGSPVVWSLVGAGLVAGAGAGFLISTRKRRAR